MSARKLSWSRTLGMSLWVLLCLYFFASFLFTLLANYFPGPFYDYWVDIAKVEKFFDSPTSLSLQEMLAVHNEAHRIFIPRILFILDHVLADGTNIFLVSVSLLCKLAILILLNLNLKTQSFTQKIVLNAIFFAGIFSLGNISNIMMTSNVQWDLMLIFSFLSLYFFPSAEKKEKLALTCLFLFASFLSHGASLVIPMVFLIHALLIRQRFLLVTSLLLLLTLMLLHFVILPEWTGEQDAPGASGRLNPLSLVLSLLPYISFVLHFIHAPVRHLGMAGFYFSLVYLILFIVCWYQYRNNPKREPFFPLLSIFLGLTVLIIAAGRVVTTPKFYWASQYEPIAILLIVSVSAAIFMHPPTRYSKWFQAIAISHCLFMLLWNQFQPYPYGFHRSNKALDSHTYMFMFDRDQFQGDALKIWVMDPDPVKAIDPFFDHHHFAYYHNKQGGTDRYQQFIRPGEAFVEANELPAFANSCAPNTAAIDYQQGLFEKYKFSTPINLLENSYLDATLHRNSYYVLNPQGIVIGFSYVFMPPKSLWPLPILKGLLNTTQATYIAEVLHGVPKCRYALVSP